MRLAVIVPFLNEERYLGELLRSIGEQRRAPDRLLLIDDGSDDDGPSMSRGQQRSTAGAACRRSRRSPRSWGGTRSTRHVRGCADGARRASPFRRATRSTSAAQDPMTGFFAATGAGGLQPTHMAPI